MPSRRKHTSNEEIARIAAQMLVSDPNKDNGSFESLTNMEMYQWLKLLGVNEVNPSLQLESSLSAEVKRERVCNKLKLALWDVQRLDLLFPGYVISESPNFNIASLSSWPNWKDAHKELGDAGIGPQKLDGYADAARLDSYVMRHFSMMAFTQADHMQGTMINPAKDFRGAWIGCKNIMIKASMDITREGGKDTPFVTYFSTDRGPGTSMLLMEILDVKQVSWPEPGPKGGSQFLSHLESRLGEIMPPDASVSEVREKLEYHLRCGEEMPEEHIRMLARLLSYNSALIDREWKDDLQGRRERNQDQLLCAVSSGFGRNRNRSSTRCDPKPQHREVCKFSKKILNEPASLDVNKFYIPARAYLSWVLEYGFSVEQEAVKMGGSTFEECPRNEYGDDRFVCRAILMPQGGVYLCDRRRSVLVRVLEADRCVASQQGMVVPFHQEGYRKFVKLIIQKVHGKQILYVWAKRVGDCIEVE
ncbi:hypothetical protein K439DRAFT_1340929 [Ramaria rubella]|nr:hypothetical protein K439DRAFT_1340929 [Ramaria rubella]